MDVRLSGTLRPWQEVSIFARTTGYLKKYYVDISNQVTKGQTLPSESESWYVNAHCYTVLNYDSGGATVTIRNPWARHPDPDGIFSLPLATFVPAYAGIVTP